MENKNKYIIREGWISIVANTLLFALKYWAGIVTGSIALIADAWHTLTDSVSSVIVLIGGKISQKPADDDHPFGHGRAEHIATMIIGVLLAIVAFDFIISAIEKFGTKEQTHFGTIAWVVTIVSILVKEALAQYAFWAAKKTNSTILKADGWHHRTDALSSVVILVGLGVGRYFWWTDAVLGFIVALMIAYASYEILAKEITSLLGESPSEELLIAICETAQKECKLPLHLHHIHLHNYGNHTEMSCHIKLPPDMSLEEAHEICTKIESIIKNRFGYITTIHPEPLPD
ncbi:cation diffusion facilitator family transporter [Prolixibacteraceae bacterium Z1-6]|uniref:Cation diffusion facilitator family transporter n=1 Tax=Draconibacterium aestuarii TaxID=2998507 RepID=A0A9X3F9R1_9BACT|nr:cation diffusion facilitator family transporter [Prolixibacteraceae bacterium Z1-6]